jgi:hypothetical protein
MLEQADGPGDAATRKAATEALRGISRAELQTLLRKRRYETNAYLPINRVLVRFHADDWLQDKSFKKAIADDLVFRQDLGVAYAEEWYVRVEEQPALMAALLAKTQSPDDDVREIAGYAFRHFCQRRHPDPWWLLVRDELAEVVPRYALHDATSDRMLAGEMLLALAAQDEWVRSWVTGPMADRFWEPYWPNLRSDIESMRVFTSTDPDWPPLPASQAASFAACQAQRDRAAELAEEIDGHALFRNPAVKADLPCFADLSAAGQQCHKRLERDEMDQLEALLAHEGGAELVSKIIEQMLLHPGWDTIEAGSSALAELILRHQRSSADASTSRWWLLEALLAADRSLWRLHYGAIDAAYNCGDADGYARFLGAVVQVGGGDAHCRVKGICADNLRQRLKDATKGERRRILEDTRIRALVCEWFVSADDIWLIEYLQLIASEMRQAGESAFVEEMLRAAASSAWFGPVADADGRSRPFHRAEPEAFLDAVERRAELLRAAGAPLPAPPA